MISGGESLLQPNIPASTVTGSSNDKRKVCSNCETTVASSWRRDTQGNPLCNSCSVYARMYGIPRPKDMRKDKISNRQRDDKTAIHSVKKKKRNSGGGGGGGGGGGAGGGGSSSRNRSQRTANTQQQELHQQVTPSKIDKKHYSVIYSNGAEDYTEILKRMNIHLDPPASIQYKTAVKQYLQSLMSASEFAMSCCKVKDQPPTPSVVLPQSPSFNKNTFNLGKPNQSITAAATATATTTATTTAGMSALDTLLHAHAEILKGEQEEKLRRQLLIPEMAPPAEEIRMKRHDEGDLSLQAPAPPPPPQHQQHQQQGHQRVMRRRYGSSTVAAALEGEDVTYMVPLDLLDEYSFWAFDVLEKMGVVLADLLV
ncbi:hypothetical protein BDR26DRAFT_856375 [Obelidium mucronatum]|nr:hypothetical protein BDR26DRAFT_856375 [Obelidium mucronatum]